MAQNFRVSIRKCRNRLYLSLWGDFDGSSALELLCLLQEKGRSYCQIVIETDRLQRVHPFGHESFHRRLHGYRDLRERICFTGSRRRLLESEEAFYA